MSPRTRATQRADDIRTRSQLATLSGPAVSSVSPRRSREKIRNVMSKIGRPQSNIPPLIAASPLVPPQDSLSINTAVSSPRGIVPPSPRKIADGERRLCRKKPRHDPHSASASTAIMVSERTQATAAQAAAQAATVLAAAPSRRSRRLIAFTTTTTHTTVSRRLAVPLEKTDQPRPTSHSTTAAAPVTRSRTLAGNPHRSSSVPRTNSPVQQTRSHARPPNPSANTTAAIEKPHRSAAPPR